jgi:hypothetical protein
VRGEVAKGFFEVALEPDEQETPHRGFLNGPGLASVVRSQMMGPKVRVSRPGHFRGKRPRRFFLATHYREQAVEDTHRLNPPCIVDVAIILLDRPELLTIPRGADSECRQTIEG